MPEVVTLGDVTVDIIAHYDTFPEEGEDAFAQTARFYCGGSAANTARTLSWLGVETALIACIGRDPWASEALRRLRRSGVLLHWPLRSWSRSLSASRPEW